MKINYEAVMAAFYTSLVFLFLAALVTGIVIWPALAVVILAGMLFLLAIGFLSWVFFNLYTGFYEGLLEKKEKRMRDKGTGY